MPIASERDTSLLTRRVISVGVDIHVQGVDVQFNPLYRCTAWGLMYSSKLVCCSADIIEPGQSVSVTKKPEHQRSLQLVLMATKVNATLHVDGKLVSDVSL